VTWLVSPERAVRAAIPAVLLLARSWRTEVLDGRHWDALVASRRPFVLVAWHETLLPLLIHHRSRGLAIVVSEARDGRYLAALAERLGYATIFGSSTRGGARALLQAVRAVRDGTPVAFTPDGPRGPRREVKPGALLAAQRGDAVLLPLAASADRAWRLRSWDRFLVPKPFARVRISYGQPFTVGPGPEGLASAADRVRAVLDELQPEAA
jgi:lysophospholipid acyltransferase (LPLAT)-like uncharacterized protein